MYTTRSFFLIHLKILVGFGLILVGCEDHIHPPSLRILDQELPLIPLDQAISFSPDQSSPDQSSPDQSSPDQSSPDQSSPDQFGMDMMLLDDLMISEGGVLNGGHMNQDFDLSMDLNIGGEMGGERGGEIGGEIGGNLPCPTFDPIQTQTHVIDLNQDPLQSGDQIQIVVHLRPSVPTLVQSGILIFQYSNLILDLSSINLNNQPIMPLSNQPSLLKLTVPIQNQTLTLNATVLSDNEPLLILTQISARESECILEGSGSASLSQKIGQGGKVSTCLNLDQYRSIQIAPKIERRDTSEYQELNGLRTDLMVQDFIFCPQNPKIIHEVEFCIESSSRNTLYLDGLQEDGYWEIDDFLLTELLTLDTPPLLLNDAVTGQSHPESDVFYCSDLNQLMCTSACTSQVYSEQRILSSLGVASAVGERPRQFQNGQIELNSLLPIPNPDQANSRFQLRVTLLDVGIEGRLSSPLFLKSQSLD
jgi:hypothetical protein